MAAAVRYAGRSLLRRPMSPAAVLLERSPAVAAALPSSSLYRCFSSKGSTSNSTGKDLAVELMRNQPVVDVKKSNDGSANKEEIKRLDALLDLLKVQHKEDTTTEVAAAAERKAVEEKKQELALLLLKAELEGGDKYKVAIRDKTSELAAAACRLRDLLLPGAQRHDLESLIEYKSDWLYRLHDQNVAKIWGLMLATGINLVLAFRA